MKDLKEYLNESIINEAINYDLKAWDVVLSAVKKAVDCGNYSQIWNFELFADNDVKNNFETEFESMIAEYSKDIEKLQKKLHNIDVKTVLKEIAEFICNNYTKAGGFGGYCYRDEAEEAGEWKKDHVLNNNNKVDFGVEEEDYYQPYEYTGPSNLKKAAQVIAKYADCTEDYDDTYDMSFKIVGDLDKKDIKKFKRELDKVSFEVMDDYSEYNEDDDDCDYAYIDMLANGTRNDIVKFANKFYLNVEEMY